MIISIICSSVLGKLPF